MADRYQIVPFESSTKWGFHIKDGTGLIIAGQEWKHPKTDKDEAIAKSFAEDKVFELQHPNGGLLTKFALARDRNGI